MDIRSVPTAIEPAETTFHCVPGDCVFDGLLYLGTQLAPALFGIAIFLFSPLMANLRDT